MTARTRAAVGLSACTLLGASLLAAPAHAAGTPAGLPRTAWFDKTYAGPTAPPSPTSAKGQLFVEGFDPGAVTTTAGADPTPPGTGALALATLHWSLPAGAEADSLVLSVVGTVPPTGVTIVACPTTSAWAPGDQQPGAAAPMFDCSTRASVGYYDSSAGTVAFADIGRTARNGAVDVALVPGTADRVVLAAPTASSLVLDPASPAPGGAEPTSAADAPGPGGAGGTGPGSTAGAGQAPGVGPGPGSGGGPDPQGSPLVGSVGAPSGDGVSSGTVAAPGTGSSGSGSSAGADGTSGTGSAAGPGPGASPVGLRLGSSVARPAAVAGLALALAFFALLIADERRRRSAAPEPAGLGRFRTLREGPAPTL